MTRPRVQVRRSALIGCSIAITLVATGAERSALTPRSAAVTGSAVSALQDPAPPQRIAVEQGYRTLAGGILMWSGRNG